MDEDKVVEVVVQVVQVAAVMVVLGMEEAVQVQVLILAEAEGVVRVVRVQTVQLVAQVVQES